MAANMKRKRVVLDVRDRPTNEDAKTWIQRTFKRLKDNNISGVAKMMLEQLPKTQASKDRIETRIVEMVIDECTNMDSKDFQQFQDRLQKELKDNSLEFLVFQTQGKRNCAWIGTETWGCSFGREVVCSWYERNVPPVEQLRCESREDLVKLHQTYNKTDGCFHSVTIGTFHDLENDLDHSIQDGEFLLQNEEIMRLRKYMEEANCTCVQVAPLESGIV